MSINCGNCKQSHETVQDVRDCYGLFPTPEPPKPIVEPLKEGVKRCDPPKIGTFTIVWGDEDDERRTFKISEWQRHETPGTMIVSLMIGPDNENDFSGVAQYDPVSGQYRLWKRYRNKSTAKLIVEWLSKSDDEQRAAAGEMYALASGRCYRCGRKLTVPASIHRGLGPDCAGK